MLETCPRCSRRLGPPLKSGRQVCADCGWSSAPATQGRKARTGTAPSKAKRQNPVLRILKLCGRIIQRAMGYAIVLIRHKVQQFQKAQPQRKAQRGQMVQGFTDRLAALEQAIPTAVDTRPWLTLEAAFQQLGGNPTDPNDVVQTLNGKGAVSFARFQLLSTDAEFRAFGLEMDTARRRADKPWLRTLS